MEILVKTARSLLEYAWRCIRNTGALPWLFSWGAPVWGHFLSVLLYGKGVGEKTCLEIKQVFYVLGFVMMAVWVYNAWSLLRFEGMVASAADWLAFKAGIKLLGVDGHDAFPGTGMEEIKKDTKKVHGLIDGYFKAETPRHIRILRKSARSLFLKSVREKQEYLERLGSGREG